MSQRIILAPGSQSRRAVLTAAGIEADTIKPNVDEDAAKASFRASDMKVRDQAMQLAELKSVKISMREPGLVIGCDQMLSLDGEAFDKPVDLADARNHLVKLSGKAHTLETAIVISEEGKPVWRYLARPKLTVRPLSDAFIDTYVEAVGEPLLSTVGAYQLEGLGAQLFTRIDGDYFSILGLPLLPLLDYLRTRGVLLS
ncbi:Maf family protein [uncultured Hyphomonas sp.]|uniref:Maf family protein n=1 Tax=uncultured Hyphomonas sp. TaxID=225298 RepID=UPI00262437A2|nr:Maf family protein [uncultured Hyphomonas sp.]